MTSKAEKIKITDSTESAEKAGGNYIGIKSSRKAKIKAMADKHGISVSKLLDGYVGLGFIIDKYLDENSQLVIQSPKGHSQDIIIPVDELLGR